MFFGSLNQKHMNTQNIERKLLIDSRNGVYIPYQFAKRFIADAWNVSKEDEQILLDGPDNENYWEAWCYVLDSAYYCDELGTKWFLVQDDGDLFAVAENAEDEDDECDD